MRGIQIALSVFSPAGVAGGHLADHQVDQQIEHHRRSEERPVEQPHLGVVGAGDPAEWYYAPGDAEPNKLLGMAYLTSKFKLTDEQLLEMLYWLKLIRAFDERLSILVRQGRVRSGVYSSIGQEAIVVGTCFGLEKEDYICPLHRDLGSFLMKGVEPKVSVSGMSTAP